MAMRTLSQLEAFLSQHGIDLQDRAFELELNSYGWRVASERRINQAAVLRIECVVDCDPLLPRNVNVPSDIGQNDRDVALMRALELILDRGFVRDESETFH